MKRMAKSSPPSPAGPLESSDVDRKSAFADTATGAKNGAIEYGVRGKLIANGLLSVSIIF